MTAAGWSRRPSTRCARRLARPRHAAAPALHRLAPLLRGARRGGRDARSTLGRLGWALGAFFLAVGVAAHALDELHGRPLRTRAVRPHADRARGASASAAPARSGSPARSPSRATLVPFVAARRVPGARLRPGAVRRPLPRRVDVRARLGRLSGADRLLGLRAALRMVRAARRGRLHAAEPRAAAASIPVRELRRRTVAVEGEQRLSRRHRRRAERRPAARAAGGGAARAVVRARAAGGGPRRAAGLRRAQAANRPEPTQSPSLREPGGAKK